MSALVCDPADALAIQQVLARYVRGVDRLDLELVRSCYHPDAHEDRGRYAGGVEDFLAWLEATLRPMHGTWHLVGVPLVELVEPEVAHVESYCLAVQYLAEEPATGGCPSNLVACRYVDRFERRHGSWLIAERTAVYEPPVPLGVTAGVASFGARSQRDRTDAAYRARSESV